MFSLELRNKTMLLRDDDLFSTDFVPLFKLFKIMTNLVWPSSASFNVKLLLCIYLKKQYVINIYKKIILDYDPAHLI